MKRHELLSSVFRTLQLTMLAMIALGIENWALWLTWGAAIAIDACIDTAIRLENEDGK
jgi:hypothetical protein